MSGACVLEDRAGAGLRRVRAGALGPLFRSDLVALQTLSKQANDRNLTKTKTQARGPGAKGRVSGRQEESVSRVGTDSSNILLERIVRLS